jgi:hypothetical protein
MSSIDFKKGDLVRWRVFSNSSDFAKRCFYGMGLENLDSIGIYLGDHSENLGSVYFPDRNKILILSNYSLEKLS